MGYGGSTPFSLCFMNDSHSPSLLNRWQSQSDATTRAASDIDFRRGIVVALPQPLNQVV